MIGKFESLLNGELNGLLRFVLPKFKFVVSSGMGGGVLICMFCVDFWEMGEDKLVVLKDSLEVSIVNCLGSGIF